MQAEPTSVAALQALTGLHSNTVREHLDALVDVGLAARRLASPAGRGRPGWLYEATDRSQEDPRPEYAGLATALAAVIVRSSDDPAGEARVAGVEWGLRLAADAGPPDRKTQAGVRRKVIEIFDRMGFAPFSDAQVREVRLTRCPLLEAAHQQPQVVCSVHLGIAQGAVQAYGADPTGAELLPFAEPGACLLRLRRPS